MRGGGFVGNQHNSPQGSVQHPPASSGALILPIGLGVRRAWVAGRGVLRTVIETISIGVAAALAGVAIGVAIAHASEALGRPAVPVPAFRGHGAPRGRRPSDARGRQIHLR